MSNTHGEWLDRIRGRKAMDELKPCPFCGGMPQTVVDDETEEKIGVKCFSCGGCIDSEKDTLDEAIEAWNRRASDG